MHHNLSWIKRYLCTTMTNERLNGLALLQVSVYNAILHAYYTNNSRTEGTIFEEETLFNRINTALTFSIPSLHLHINITDKYS